MPRQGIKECYRAPYQRTCSQLPNEPGKCHSHCDRLYPYDSWGTIRYPNRLLHDSCHIRCNQKNPGYEHFPDKDIQSIEFFGNTGEILTGAFQLFIKYGIEALAVALAAYYIPAPFSPDFSEIMQIVAVALATFFILDQFAPAVGLGARLGSGFGIGGKLVGFR